MIFLAVNMKTTALNFQGTTRRDIQEGCPLQGKVKYDQFYIYNKCSMKCVQFTYLQSAQFSLLQMNTSFTFCLNYGQKIIPNIAGIIIPKIIHGQMQTQQQQRANAFTVVPTNLQSKKNDVINKHLFTRHCCILFIISTISALLQ